MMMVMIIMMMIIIIIFLEFPQKYDSFEIKLVLLRYILRYAVRTVFN